MGECTTPNQGRLTAPGEGRLGVAQLSIDAVALGLDPERPPGYHDGRGGEYECEKGTDR